MFNNFLPLLVELSESQLAVFVPPPLATRIYRIVLLLGMIMKVPIPWQVKCLPFRQLFDMSAPFPLVVFSFPHGSGEIPIYRE